MKAIARLALGWLLMLAGTALMLEAGTPIRPHSRWLTTVAVLGGFGLLIAGVWLRRQAARPDPPH